MITSSVIQPDDFTSAITFYEKYLQIHQDFQKNMNLKDKLFDNTIHENIKKKLINSYSSLKNQMMMKKNSTVVISLMKH